MDLDQVRDPRLGPLLRAAAAPGQPHEVAGEAEAVAGFRGAYRPVRRRRRLLAAALAAFAAVSVGGTAFAASSGHLPAAVRSWLDGGGGGGGGGASPQPSTASAEPRRSASPPAVPAGPEPSGSSRAAPVPPAEACRSWQAFRADPRSRPITAAQRRDLAALAGGSGEPVIDEFCRRLLGGTEPGASPTHGPRSAVPTPSRRAGRV
ncbi:hypothetical protein ACQP1P_19375 [Dactylosporangium sp. CA-052675]|uniref:hypothetical protein n=1 Tax=Dactylosporangium sp. CA-052675 TaxID=3239927 RepID=UPI003D918ACC